MDDLLKTSITRRAVLKSGVLGVLGSAMPPELLAAGNAGEDRLDAEFLSPSIEAGPWVYWFFMDGNLSQEGITADLEAMKAAGISGAIYFEVGLGIPRGPVEFMSPAWKGLLGHAFTEADRLGLQLGLASGPGWCGTGGPWIKPEESMQHLVASETTVAGPGPFHGVLPRPEPRKPFFGEETLSPELHKVWKDFYLDVVTLAFPTPKGNMRIEDIDEKALYTRGSFSSQIPGPYSSRPWVRASLPTSSAYINEPREYCIPKEGVIDLTEKLGSDGVLRWDVPPGQWTILRFGRTITGQTTRPSPKPGLGLETDKFSPLAITDHFDAYIMSLLSKTGPPQHRGRGLTTLHFDSWEMSSQNWSPKMRQEFLRRRGYDLLQFLPTFNGFMIGSAELSERFLWDFRQTAQELLVENQGLLLRKLGQRYGLQFSLEPYDLNPSSDLYFGSAADLPSGEFWSKNWEVPTEFSIVEATSIGHTQGRPIIAAEAFTALQTELWHQYPGSMKEQSDWAFCSGVNRLVFHRFQAQPWEDRRPGMTMGPDGGYGVHWDRTQTWWPMVGAYHKYVSRCQQMLRRGVSVADILYLAPEGAPNVFVPPPSALTPGAFADRLGYNFDGCAPETLIARGTVQNGRITFPDGMSYGVLILPQVKTMRPALLQKIVQLVDDGATVIGAPPQSSPTLVDYPVCDQVVQMLAAKLWDGSRQRALGKGTVILDTEATANDKENPLVRARWIWARHGDGRPDPIPTCYLSRLFELNDSESVASAEILLTATGELELFVNGTSVQKHNDVHRVRRVDITSLLAGRNEILVRVAADPMNPGGMIASVRIYLEDGSQRVIDCDRDWVGSFSKEGTRTRVQELGDFGMAPWKLNDKSIQERAPYPSYRFVAKILERRGVPPDFEADGPVRYTHRQDGGTDLYFIGNKRPEKSRVTCSFRVSGKLPEWWNPVTGERHDLPEFSERNGRISVRLVLEPFESGFVIFRRLAPLRSGEGSNASSVKTAMTISSAWRVSFDPRWGGPAESSFPRLEDWTKRPEPAIRYYSGTAVYETTFDCGSHLPRARGGQMLGLGTVKNIASVELNGRDLGVVWCDPWRVAIPPGLLLERDNILKITVANLWINRLIGDSGLPPKRRVTWIPGTYPFHPTDPLQPSGLLGPVTLQVTD